MVIVFDYPYVSKPRPSFKNSRAARMVEEDYERNAAVYLKKIETIASNGKLFAGIPLAPGKDPTEPNWVNDWLTPLDEAMIYTLLKEKNPPRYVECGSGNSTKFAARAIRDNGLRTKIISIDPRPRAEIDAICDKIFRIPFEEMDLGFFRGLTGEDIFVMDGSHRSFPNSDVTVFFTEALPELPSGMIYGIHDIAFPWESYTERYYNEQYMLAAYLTGGAMGDKIHFPARYIAESTGLVKKLDEDAGVPGLRFSGKSYFFWMEKG
jgi:hypothetical protein